MIPTIRNKTAKYILCLLFFLLVSCFLLLFWKASPVFDTFMPGNQELELSDIIWYSDSGTFQTEQLPAAFPCNDDGTALISATLPEDCPSTDNTLCFRASQQSVRIWLEGELLMEHGTETLPRYLGKSPGSSWILIRLPEGFAGKEIEIELNSPYKDYQGKLNTVYLGSEGSILNYIFRQFGPGLLISAMLLTLSILILFIYVLFLARNVRSKNIFCIGLFGLLSSIWMIGESHMLQFFTGHLTAWLYITLITMHLLPMPLLILVENLPDFPYQRICRYARTVIIVYVSLLLFLQTTGIRDMMEMLSLSQVLLFILCMIFLALIYWDFFHNKNKKVLPTAISVGVLCIFSIGEILSNAVNSISFLGNYMRTGVLAFFVIMSIFILRNALQVYTAGLNSAYYKQLSYTDQMTGCLNRRACMEREAAWMPGESDALLMVDLNDLKLVNDSLGHHAGDDYIIACAAAMKEIFHKKGNCYRMGGDEFLFWGSHISETELADMEQRLIELVHKKCQNLSPHCMVATGMAIYRPTDLSIEETLKRADLHMYENKRRMKAASAEKDQDSS